MNFLKFLKSTRRQMCSKYHMWTYSILWTHSIWTHSHSEAMKFLLICLCTYQYKKLKTDDRVKTRNSSFIPSFNDSLFFTRSFLITLSCSPLLHVILTIPTCVSICTCTLHGTGKDPQRTHRIFLSEIK